MDRQSAPSRKLEILVVPSAREPSITALWEMDLSPGTVSSPRSEDCFLMIMAYPYLSVTV